MISLLLILCQSFSYAKGTELHKWQSCARDTDCVAVPGLCRTHETVHKKHRRAYENYLEKALEVANCPPAEEDPHPLHQKSGKATPSPKVKSTPKCISKKCTLVAGESKNG